jgi:hypothetical protein
VRIGRHAGDQTAPNGCDQCEDGDGHGDGLPDGHESGVSVDHNQGIRARGRMNGLGHKHEDESQNESQYIDPNGVAEKLKRKNADERTANVTAEKRAGLGRGCAGKAEQENGGAAERGEEEWS